jgi:RNA polymerase sigma-70 factor (ECF subfamily)
MAFEGISLALPFTEDARAELQSERESGTAVADLVQTYSPLLFRVANSILRSPAEAEDIVQDLFVRVLERREALGDILDMRVWLVRIAWNLALTRRRRIRPEQIDAEFAERLAGSTVPADQALAEAQRIKAVLRELERLPKQEHHVLLLSAVEELSTAEISAILGKSESAVRALLFRARTRLRDRLNVNQRGGKR